MIKYDLASLTKIGRLHRTTGVDGLLLGEVREEYQSFARTAQYFFVVHLGQTLPYFLSDIDLEDGQISIRFEDIKTPEDARTLCGKDLYAETQKISDAGIKPRVEGSHIREFKLYNGEELIGTIHDIIEYPSQQMIVIGSEAGPLIPLVEEWIVRLDPLQKSVYMQFDPELLTLK